MHDDTGNHAMPNSNLHSIRLGTGGGEINLEEETVSWLRHWNHLARFVNLSVVDGAHRRMHLLKLSKLYWDIKAAGP